MSESKDIKTKPTAKPHLLKKTVRLYSGIKERTQYLSQMGTDENAVNVQASENMEKGAALIGRDTVKALHTSAKSGNRLIQRRINRQQRNRIQNNVSPTSSAQPIRTKHTALPIKQPTQPPATNLPYKRGKALSIQRTAKKAVQDGVRATKKTASIAKGVVTAMRMLIVAIGSIIGGGFLSILLIILLVGAVLISPFAIFFHGGGNLGTGYQPLPAVISQINTDLQGEISRIQQQAGSVDILDIYVDGSINGETAQVHNWPDILAVFSVLTTTDGEEPQDIIELDRARIQKLKEVFEDANVLTHSLQSVTVSEGGKQVQKRSLQIRVHSRDYAELISHYDMTEEQAGMVCELMDSKNYAMWSAIVDQAMTGDTGPATDWGDIIDLPPGGMDIPLFLQTDYPEVICYIPQGDGTLYPASVKNSGCGAASMSMVIAYLAGDTAQTPKSLFTWAYNTGQYHGSGLSHDTLVKMAALYGIDGTWVPNDASRVTAALRSGYPVIAHMGPGMFTSSGHYIVLRGITDDGYVLVNDPNSKSKSQYAYPLSTIQAQAKTSVPFMICVKQY